MGLLKEISTTWLLPPAATGSSKAGGQVRVGHPEPSNPMILIHFETKWPGLSCWNSLLQLSSPIPRPPRQTSRNHQEDFCLSLPHHHHLATGTRLSLESIKTDGNHPSGTSLPFNRSPKLGENKIQERLLSSNNKNRNSLGENIPSGFLLFHSHMQIGNSFLFPF